MMPILVTVGSMPIYSVSVFIIIAWLIFSFLFWRSLRGVGTDEERIFDLTFYGSIIAIIGARIVYVFLYPSQFVAAPIKVAAIWIAPGLSLEGGLFVGVLALLLLSKRLKVRWAHLLDALGYALPFSLAVGHIGGLLGGTPVGKVTGASWGLPVVGYSALRHPVSLYESAAMILVGITVWLLLRRARVMRYSYGTIGVTFFLGWSILSFIVEFFKESSIYWLRFTPNQWAMVVVFCESAGALYVKGGGKQAFLLRIRLFQVRIKVKSKEVYEWITRRHSNKT